MMGLMRSASGRPQDGTASAVPPGVTAGPLEVQLTDDVDRQTDAFTRYRGQIMRKLGARSVPELVSMATKLRLL